MTGVRIPHVYEPDEVRVRSVVSTELDLVLLAFGRRRQEEVPLVGPVIMYDEHVRITRAAARRLRDALIEEIGLGTDDDEGDDQ